jgi:protein TonB
MLLKKVVPAYPDAAKSMRIDGTVTIKATIGPDGHVGNLQIINGPGVLQKPATDAVRQWLYRPFDVMGEPRPVQVELHVIFTIG